MRFTRSLRSELTIRRQKWIEQPPFGARIYADAGHHLLPVHVRVPCGVLEPPDPKTWCEIDDFHVRQHSLGHGLGRIAHSGGAFLREVTPCAERSPGTKLASSRPVNIRWRDAS